jgi:hypothetical protein
MSQVDVIGAKSCGNLFIEGNFLQQTNLVSWSHNDCIQFVWVENAVVKNNYLYNATYDKEHLNQMIMWEDLRGDFYIYNNVFYYPNAHTNMNVFYDKDNIYPHTFYIYSNTFYAQSTGHLAVIFTPDVYFKNNLIYGISGGGMDNHLPVIEYSRIDGNLYSTNINGTYDASLTMAEINALGGETSGNPSARYHVDPLFVSESPYPNQDLRVQSGSPCRNAGVDLPPPFNTDINGTVRQPGQFTIGAYQYEEGPDITPPEVIGAYLIDSVKLVVKFSEALDETTAEEENNYSISNNIDIFNASLSGSEVTLQTSAHYPGSYIVTVVNVEDLAGNIIAQSNTAEYSRIPPDSLIMLPIEDVYGVIQEPDHTPEKTIDGLGALGGDPDSRWAAEPMPEELTFDLGSIRKVCKTRLSFYNWNNGRIYTYSISVSSDNNNWITIIPQATSALQEEWTIDEFSTIDARYVRVHFFNNNQSDWAGLWEGEIWGINLTPVDPVSGSLPNKFSLGQNYPNPFNPSTTISYSIRAASIVTLKVYDVLGNEIIRLVNEEKSEGDYDVHFDATGLPSGIYFYRLQAGSFINTKKMILMK